MARKLPKKCATELKELVEEKNGYHRGHDKPIGNIEALWQRHKNLDRAREVTDSNCPSEVNISND